MKATVFNKIEAIISIPFVEEEVATDSVCFACSDELRVDFRIQFSSYDVVNYVYGIMFELYRKEDMNLESILCLEIPYPINAISFWNNSVIGKINRQELLIEEIEFLDVTELNWV